NGHRQLRGTQADARAVNKNFEQIDIPTDKAGLMAFVQALYSELDTGPNTSTPEQLLVGHPDEPEPTPGSSTSVVCDDEGHSPNEYGQCDDCRAWVAEPTPRPRTNDDVEEL